MTLRPTDTCTAPAVYAGASEGVDCEASLKPTLMGFLHSAHLSSRRTLGRCGGQCQGKTPRYP
jgi:hypothetical protein